MKKLYFPQLLWVTLVFVFNAGNYCLAQNIGVGINSTGTAPDNSAMLDINSPNKGLLIPRVSLTSISSASPVTNPANGLMIYNTNALTTNGNGAGLYIYDSINSSTGNWLYVATPSNGPGTSGQVLSTNGTGAVSWATGLPSTSIILWPNSTAPAGYTYTGNSVTMGQGWSTQQSMLSARSYTAGGVINNILYVVGGSPDNTTTASNLNEAYDPSTNSWATKTAMTTARFSPAAGVINNILYVAGGGAGGGVILTTNEAYDPSANSWATKTPMTTARFTPGEGVINNIMYVVGGYDGSSFISTNEAYDPSVGAGGTWTTETPMTTARGSQASGIINNVLYVAGGNNSSSFLATNEAYDPSIGAGGTWATKTSMPGVSCNVPSGAVINNIFYVVGGYNGSFLSSNYAYNPVTDSWSTQPPMLTAREGILAGVINNIMYVVGGYNGASLTTNEAYNPGTSYFYMQKN